jgi:hypothetical protein
MAEKRLTWYRWEDRDPIAREKWTAWTVSVYAPTYERRYATILLSVANGGGRCLTRYASLGELRRRVTVPEDGIERLERAEVTALSLLVEIRRDWELIQRARAMKPGETLVNATTGEILSQAEDILRGKRK